MPGERTQAVLKFITRFEAEHGEPPTFREIGEALAMRSTNTVSYHVHRLVAVGELQELRRRGRPTNTRKWGRGS